MPKVFISHSTEDRTLVRKQILDPLFRAGIEIWYSVDSIRTADHWERTILQGLQGCDWFLVVLSPRAAKSEWVKDELHWAMEERQGRVIPVLIEPCDLRQFHIRLPRIQVLNFT